MCGWMKDDWDVCVLVWFGLSGGYGEGNGDDERRGCVWLG